MMNSMKVKFNGIAELMRIDEKISVSRMNGNKNFESISDNNTFM